MCAGSDRFGAVENGSTTNTEYCVNPMGLSKFDTFLNFRKYRVTDDAAELYKRDAISRETLTDGSEQTFAFDAFAAVAQQHFTHTMLCEVLTDSGFLSGAELDLGWIVEGEIFHLGLL
ncbi:hypothetical protein D3C79_721380 [compost metagenome]